MHDAVTILNNLRDFYQSQPSTVAAFLDNDADALRRALNMIISLGCFYLKAPLASGGHECDENHFQQFKEEVVGFSGALAFLQHQHQASIRLMAISDNEKLKAIYLPKFIKGTALAAVGTSQLRKEQNCSLKGRSVNEGFLVNGFIPWASGYRLFDKIIVGFATEDNEAVYALIPFEEDNLKRISISEPLVLSAANSMNTVNVSLMDYTISNQDILLKTPLADFSQNKFVIINTGSFQCGLAMSAINYLIQSRSITTEKLKALIFQLRGEITKLRYQIINELEHRKYHNAERLRANGILLTNQVIQLACTLTKGQSSLLEHPINRLHRESLLFNALSVSATVTDFITEHHTDLVSLCV